jgi:hypothetical protein
MRSRPGAMGMISLGWPVARFTARLDLEAVLKFEGDPFQFSDRLLDAVGVASL